METWLLELLKAIGRFFLHPVLYIFIISSFLAGYFRVKRERKDFSIKVHDVWYELRTSLYAGAGIGIILSLLLVGTGIVLSTLSLTIIAIWTICFALFAQYRYLSAAYSIGIAIFFCMFSPDIQTGIAGIDGWIGESGATSLSALAILLAALLFAEGFLITKRAVTTPQLMQGKRGLKIGVHVCKRLWLVPVFVLIPGDGVKELFAWWPVISVDSQTFSLFLIPFGIGVFRSIRGSLPSGAIFYTGRRVMGLSMLVFVLALISLWLPGVAIAAAGIAMLGRFTITIREQLDDGSRKPYFSVSNYGFMVLDTLPNSPAAKMGLRPGEVIVKVNGVVPKSLREFYLALQHNTAGAFCKMEVVDTNGELRFVQCAMFAGDHHELGILFVQRDYDWSTEAV